MTNTLFAFKLFEFQMSLGDAAIIAVLGLLIVFAVLAVLVGLLTAFKAIFNIKITKKSDNADKSVAAQNDSADDFDEIVAAISAAIACMNEQDGETATAPFVIKSITQIK